MTIDREISEKAKIMVQSSGNHRVEAEFAAGHNRVTQLKRSGINSQMHLHNNRSSRSVTVFCRCVFYAAWIFRNSGYRGLLMIFSSPYAIPLLQSGAVEEQ